MLRSSETIKDIKRFYRLLNRLEDRVGGKRRLECCDSGTLNWPKRGVYFFFEDGEDRSDTGRGPRVVRVGTHALKTGAASTLWSRLRAHKGYEKSGGGSRGTSIFRKIVGKALAKRRRILIPTWDNERAADPEVKKHEKRVSQVIRAMPFLWLDVDDEPGPGSKRGYIERHAIALLSNFKREPAIDPASSRWLGRLSPPKHEKVRKSGLWNQEHVEDDYDSAFLDVLESLIEAKPLASNADRILELLRRKPGLDDDEIAEALNIRPRQAVNKQCRLLERKGLVRRKRGPREKIVNVVTAPEVRARSRELPPVHHGPRKRPTEQTRLPSGPITVPRNLSRTLLIVPCSGSKEPGGTASKSGPSMARKGVLGPELAQELIHARAQVALELPVDNNLLMPAWERYTGTLYKDKKGRNALRQARKRKAHVIILSGGYGAVLAKEPIGTYNGVLKLRQWPDGLLQELLADYAKRHRVRCVRAFASRTSDYRKLLDGVAWSDAGVKDAVLITPLASKPAMVTSPKAQGEALDALMEGTLTTDWNSSDGLEIEALVMK